MRPSRGAAVRAWRAAPGWLAPLVALAVAATPATAQIEIEARAVGLRAELGGWVQPRIDWDSPVEGDAHLSLRRLRLDLRGEVLDPRLSFRLQSDLLRRGHLRDAYIDFRVHEMLSLQAGKLSVPFGWRVSPRRDPFPDRDIATSRFGSPSRDIGLLVHGSDASRRFEYAAGALDGNGGRLDQRSGGYLLTGRVGYAISGVVPRDETDPGRTAVRNLAVGLGLQGARRSALRDWSLERSPTGNELGDWTTAAFDLVAQHGGIAATAKYFLRSVHPSDPSLDGYAGAAASLTLGVAIVPGLEVVARRGHGALDRHDGTTGEREWGMGVNLYHRGHRLKSRLHYQARQPTGSQPDRRVVADLSVQF